MQESATQHIGVVIIGRNEGERLRRCLQSVLRDCNRIVYVDSGSVDDSVAGSRSMGVEVVELDPARPFSAARARNEGFDRLMSLWPDVKYVQVVDGDCELLEGWLAAASNVMAHDDTVAVVCGRRRERFPDATVYNRLCDLEWNTPVGEALACGGDALFRVIAWRDAGGYDAAIIAGEEPEFCYRLRENGWTVQRVDHDMTLHDASMTRFSQWWKRTRRSGAAYALCFARHGHGLHRFRAREMRSIIAWGFVLPLCIVCATASVGWWSMIGVGAYVVIWARIAMYRLSRGDDSRQSMHYAFFCTLGKFAQAMGVMGFAWSKLTRGGRMNIIEYKGTETKGPQRSAA